MTELPIRDLTKKLNRYHTSINVFFINHFFAQWAGAVEYTDCSSAEG